MRGLGGGGPVAVELDFAGVRDARAEADGAKSFVCRTVERAVFERGF
jgi:hypothetical protein